jgi:cell division protein FtsB
VKLQTAESGKWNCDGCRTERLSVLEEELRNAQTQMDELTRKNEALVEQIRLMASGKDDRKQAEGY